MPYRPFGKAILGCLPVEGDSWKVPEKTAVNLEWRDRKDLRDLVICSIDPPGKRYSCAQVPIKSDIASSLGCQDIDDALHARKLPNGNIEAGVRECRRIFFRARLITEQILRMSLTSFYPTIRWIRKPPPEGRLCISSISGSICFPLFWGPTCARCGHSLRGWRSPSYGSVAISSLIVFG